MKHTCYRIYGPGVLFLFEVWAISELDAWSQFVFKCGELFDVKRIKELTALGYVITAVQ